MTRHRTTGTHATHTLITLALSTLLASTAAHAQGTDIARMKLGDGELNCLQIFSEIRSMDNIASGAAGQAVAPAAPTPAPSPAPTAAQAANTAQSLLGGLGGLFGGNRNAAVAGTDANRVQGALGFLNGLQNAAPAPSAAPAPAPAPAAGLAGFLGGLGNLAQAKGNTGNAPATQALSSLGNALSGGQAQAGATGAQGQLQQALQGGMNELSTNKTLQDNMRKAMGESQGMVSQIMNQADPNAIRNMMLQSPDPAVRAKANDPAAIAEVQAALRNPATQAQVQQGLSQMNNQAMAALASGGAGLANTGGAAANPQLIAQANARKEHLTGLFLSKSCKLSDMPK